LIIGLTEFISSHPILNETLNVNRKSEYGQLVIVITAIINFVMIF